MFGLRWFDAFGLIVTWYLVVIKSTYFVNPSFMYFFSWRVLIYLCSCLLVCLRRVYSMRPVYESLCRCLFLIPDRCTGCTGCWRSCSCWCYCGCCCCFCACFCRCFILQPLLPPNLARTPPLPENTLVNQTRRHLTLPHRPQGSSPTARRRQPRPRRPPSSTLSS